MIGLDPNGHPKNKAGLLAASWLSGTFGAAFMLLLAWNASLVLFPMLYVKVVLNSIIETSLDIRRKLASTQ
jgi:hypothetical protein